MKKFLLAAAATLVGIALGQPVLNAASFTLGSDVTAYDVAVFDNKTHVAFQS